MIIRICFHLVKYTLYSRLWPNEYVSSSNYKCIFLLNKCCQFSYLPSHFPPQCPGWHGLLLKCSSGHHQQCYSKKGEEINTYLRRSVSMILWHWTVLFHYSHSRIRFVNILMFSICNDFDIDLSLCSTRDGDWGPDNQFYPGPSHSHHGAGTIRQSPEVENEDTRLQQLLSL